MATTDYIGTFVKDPQDISDTGIDWDAASFLANRSTTIASSEWTVTTGLTVVTDTNTTTTTLIRLSGGTNLRDYEAVNHVVLANGEEYDRTILVQVRQR